MSQILKMSMNKKGPEQRTRSGPTIVLGLSYRKVIAVCLLFGLATREQLTQAKDLTTIDMESSAYEIVKKRHHGDREHAPEKPIMKIDLREGGPPGEDEKELVH